MLIVVAHPDDEVLGCGGTVVAAAAKGTSVSSCIVAAQAEARNRRPEVARLMDDMGRAHEILGVRPVALGDFPNIRLNTVPHIELVQFIEAAIESSGADILFTHHPWDLNDDHRQVSKACQAAARLFQRRTGVARLRALYFMEILSATDWSFPGQGEPFRADTFFEVGAEGLQQKLRALQAYQGVMRPYPHPRSLEAVEALARLRGAEAGLNLAEAFQTAFCSFAMGEY